MANSQENADQAPDNPQISAPISSSGGGSNPDNSRACAACKYQRRRCAPNCPLAPYFPPTEPEKFANVHKAYGLRNVMRIFKEVPPESRDDAMNTMIWEADARAKDPIGGCYRIIQGLQDQVRHYQAEVETVKAQLSYYKNLEASAAASAPGAASGSTSSAAPASNYFPPPPPGNYFPPPPPPPQGFYYPDLTQLSATLGLGLGFNNVDGNNNHNNPIPFPPPESFLPPLNGYQYALAVITNRNLTPGASSSVPPPPEPEPYFPAPAGGQPTLIPKEEDGQQTMMSSSSDLSDSFFPVVGGFQEALKQAMGYPSVDRDVGLLSMKLNGKDIASSSSHPQPTLPVPGHEDHDDAGFIPNNVNPESPRVKDGEKNDKSLTSQPLDGSGGGGEEI